MILNEIIETIITKIKNKEHRSYLLILATTGIKPTTATKITANTILNIEDQKPNATIKDKLRQLEKALDNDKIMINPIILKLSDGNYTVTTPETYLHTWKYMQTIETLKPDTKLFKYNNDYTNKLLKKIDPQLTIKKLRQIHKQHFQEGGLYNIEIDSIQNNIKDADTAQYMNNNIYETFEHYINIPTCYDKKYSVWNRLDIRLTHDQKNQFIKHLQKHIIELENQVWELDEKNAQYELVICKNTSEAILKHIEELSANKYTHNIKQEHEP